MILACRNLARANQIRTRLIRATGNASIEVAALDLQSFDSIAAFAQSLRRPVHALVNNAGIFYAPPYRTIDGLDGTFQTNVAGPFLLSLLLLPALRASGRGARIVNLSSRAHLHADAAALTDAKYCQPFVDSAANRFRAYGNSKLLLVLCARRLRELLAETCVTVHCVDPGNVETAIYRTFPPLANPLLFALQAPIRFFAVRTPLEGAQGVLHALRSQALPFYVSNGTESAPDADINALVGDRLLVELIWSRMEELLAGYLSAARHRRH